MFNAKSNFVLLFWPVPVLCFLWHQKQRLHHPNLNVYRRSLTYDVYFYLVSLGQLMVATMMWYSEVSLALCEAAGRQSKKFSKVGGTLSNTNHWFANYYIEIELWYSYSHRTLTAVILASLHLGCKSFLLQSYRNQTSLGIFWQTLKCDQLCPKSPWGYWRHLLSLQSYLCQADETYYEPFRNRTLLKVSLAWIED